MNVAPAQADPMCNEGGPPEGAATCAFDGGAVWVSPNGLVGVTTAGNRESAGPQRVADADSGARGRRPGQRAEATIVSDGRAAHLYLLEGCRINPVFDGQGNPFMFDLQNLRGNGTGVGCEDLGDGRHLVALQALPAPTEQPCAAPRSPSSRATPPQAGRTFAPATPAASAITACGAQTMANDGCSSLELSLATTWAAGAAPSAGEPAKGSPAGAQAAVPAECVDVRPIGQQSYRRSRGLRPNTCSRSPHSCPTPSIQSASSAAAVSRSANTAPERTSRARCRYQQTRR